MDLLGASDVAALLGVSRQRVHQLADAPDFPKPAASVGTSRRQRVWTRAAIEKWAAKTGRLTREEG